MFAIAPYAVELLDEQRQPVDLWDLSGKRKNLRRILLDYYESELSSYTPISHNKLFRVAQIFEGAGNSVAGIYETGEHGTESPLYDVRQKKVSHRKQRTEADMVPFHFLFALPKADSPARRKKGLLLLARHKNFGIRTITIPHLRSYVEGTLPGLSLEVRRIVPARLAQTLLSKGSLKAIRLIRYRLPSTLEGLLDEDDVKQIQDIEIVIKAKRKGAFHAVRAFEELLAGQKQIDSFAVAEEMQPNNIKLDVEIGGRMRRIDVGRQRVLSNVDITEDVELDRTGHPTSKSWYAVADELASEFLSSNSFKVAFKTSTKDRYADEDPGARAA